MTINTPSSETKRQGAIMDHDTIHTIEDHSFRAWPALESRYYDGWLLRFSAGYTRRSNSVNPVYQGDNTDLTAKIAACESMYRERGLTINFKMTPAAIPAALDAALEARGYVRHEGALVQTLALETLDAAALTLPDDLSITQWDTLNDRWLNTFITFNQVEQRHIPTMQRTLNHILPQHTFMMLCADDEPLAVGLAVNDQGYLGLFDVVTSAAHRRQGHGISLVRSMLAWGREQAATLAYLQVTPENAPALALYEKLGFQTAYEYWYRSREES